MLGVVGGAVRGGRGGGREGFDQQMEGRVEFDFLGHEGVGRGQEGADGAGRILQLDEGRFVGELLVHG